MFIIISFWTPPPSFDASNDRGALSANVIKTAEVCFLSAAQDVMKEAIYYDNIVFETNLRQKNDLTYNILRKCTCFLSAAQGVMKEAIYYDNIVFETNLRQKNDLTYNILRKCTCKTYGNRLYKNLDANLYRGTKTRC